MAIPTVGMTRVACNTSTGNQAITVNCGGLTPKAALFFLTAAVTDNTARDNAVVSVGAATTTSARWAICSESQHNVATANVASLASTTSCIQVLSGAGAQTVDAAADFVSFGADTVTINWSDAPASAWLLTVVAFAGADLSVFTGTQSLGNTTDNALDVTAPGFEPDVVFAGTVIGNSVGGEFSFGFAHNDRAGTVTQRGLNWSELEAATMTVGTATEDRGVLVDLNGSQGLDFYAELGTFDSSGFTITTRNGGANNQTFYYLALKLDAATSAKVYTFSTPTSTGAASDTGAGFQPQAVLYLTGMAEAARTIYTNDNASTFGLSVVGPSAQYNSTVTSRDNVADADNQSLSRSTAFEVPTTNGTAAIQGTFSSFDGSGANYSFSTVTGTSKWWPALAFKVAAAGDTNARLLGGDLLNGGLLFGRLVQ